MLVIGSTPPTPEGAITTASPPAARGRRSTMRSRAAGIVCCSASSHRAAGRRRRASLTAPRSAARKHRCRRFIHSRTMESVRFGTTCSTRDKRGGD
eukprot:1189749-Prymnesium_polylepis.1